MLVIHNIDGSMLRNSVAQVPVVVAPGISRIPTDTAFIFFPQTALSTLAAVPSIYLLASIDHINAPLSEWMGG